MSSKKRRDKNQPFSAGSLHRRAPDGSRLFLTVEETAMHFNVAKSTVLNWVKVGVVPSYSLHGRVYFNKNEVDAYWQLFNPERR